MKLTALKQLACSCSSHKSTPPPRGESRHETHDQIHAVYHNCSFYWHHPGFDNFSMDRLLKKTLQKDCSMKDNIFFVDIFSRQSVPQKADRTCFLEEQLRIQ